MEERPSACPARALMCMISLSLYLSLSLYISYHMYMYIYTYVYVYIYIYMYTCLYHKELKPTCIDTGMSFEERVAKREAEAGTETICDNIIWLYDVVWYDML